MIESLDKMKRIKQRLYDKKSRDKSLLCYVFMFMVFILALTYAFRGFTLIKADDGFNQYYPVYIYVGKYLRNVIKSLLQGDFVLTQFDFQIGLGEEIIPTLNYYGFGNPIYLLSMLIPCKNSELGYAIIIYVHLFLAGISYIKYCNYKGISCSAVLSSVFVYLFSGYTLTYGFWYPPYLMILITIPLMCLGIEKTVEQKNINKCLIAAFVLQGLNGFYHLYMLIIFGIIYSIIVCVNRKKINKASFKNLCRIASQVLIGIMISGVILIPSVIGYFYSSRTLREGNMSLEKMFNIQVQLFSKMFMHFSFPSGYDVDCIELQCPLFVFIIVLMAWRKQKHNEIKKLGITGLIMYLLCVYSSYILQGFPDILYYNRWISFFYFIIAILFAISLDEIEKINVKEIGIILAITIFYIGFYITKNRGLILYYRKGYVWIFTLIIVGIIGWLLAKMIKSDYSKYVIGFATNLCVIFMIVFVITIADGKWYYKCGGNAWRAIGSNKTQVYQLETNKFERLDLLGDCLNQSTIQGFYGISEYYSIINANKIRFFQEYGLLDGEQAFILRTLKQKDNLEDLLCVRIYEREDEPLEIEINQDCFPLGVTFSRYMTQKDAELLSAEQKIEHSLEYIILDTDETNLLSKDGIDCERQYMQNVDIRKNTVSGNVRLNEDSMLFIAIPNSKGWSAYIDGKKTTIYNADYGFMAIKVNKGESEIRLVYHTPGVYFGMFMTVVGIIIFIRINKKGLMVLK